MKLLTIICEASVDAKVLEILDQCGVGGYTRLSGWTGKGNSGLRDGTPIWPGINSVILAGMSIEQEKSVHAALTNLDEQRGGRLALKVYSVEAQSSF